MLRCMTALGASLHDGGSVDHMIGGGMEIIVDWLQAPKHHRFRGVAIGTNEAKIRRTAIGTNKAKIP